jgi:histidine triad (HIT) family protein
MSACTFCEIVVGTSPASVIYQDDCIMAFMTIRPTRQGELVVIPKAHVDHFCDLPDDLSAHLTGQAQRISRNVRARLAPERVGWVVHGYGVPHAHLIVVPQFSANDITSARFAFVEAGEVRFDHRRVPQAPRDELDRLAKLLA